MTREGRRKREITFMVVDIRASQILCLWGSSFSCSAVYTSYTLHALPWYMIMWSTNELALYPGLLVPAFVACTY